MRRLLPIIIIGIALIAFSIAWRDSNWPICWKCFWLVEADEARKGYIDCRQTDRTTIVCRREQP